jgi:hypothetical protein
MKKCSCYKIKTERRYKSHPITEELIGYNVEVGVCSGTKEMDVCRCNGDETKCSFYPRIRDRAKQELTIEDAIEHFKYGISHDIFKEPVTSYAQMAVEALEKQIPKKPHYEADGYADGVLAYDYAKCPICGHDFECGINDWGCAYCQDCGQALDWDDSDT